MGFSQVTYKIHGCQTNGPFARSGHNWYKITYTGEQVAQWDFQTKGKFRWTCTSCIVLEVLLRNLLTSICNFIPCDRIVQRVYFCTDKNLHGSTLCLHGTEWTTERTTFWTAKALFTRVRTNCCVDKNLHGSTLCLHGTSETGPSFEWLSVQFWDLKKAGQHFDRHGFIFHTDSCKHLNRATFCSDSAVMVWNQMPRLV